MSNRFTSHSTYAVRFPLTDCNEVNPLHKQKTGPVYETRICGLAWFDKYPGFLCPTLSNISSDLFLPLYFSVINPHLARFSADRKTEEAIVEIYFQKLRLLEPTD